MKKKKQATIVFYERKMQIFSDKLKDEGLVALLATDNSPPVRPKYLSGSVDKAEGLLKVAIEGKTKMNGTGKVKLEEVF